MKIRKFNESNNEEEIDVEYISHCFADLLDAGAELKEKELITPYGNRRGPGGTTMLKYVELIFHIKTEVSLGDTGGKNNLVWREFISRRNKLSNYIDNQNYNNNILQKVKIAFTQLSDEYPNYKLYPVIEGNKLKVRIYPF
jgi:hypothetical protein